MKKMAVLFAATLFVFAACGSAEKEVSQIKEIPTNCEIWFNGCNNCSAKDGELIECTLSLCTPEIKGEPRCKKFATEDVNKALKEELKIPADCTAWFDGCNNCMVKDGEIAGCTRKFCPPEATEAPKCTAFAEEEKKELVEEELSAAKSCAKSGATWLVAENECEYTSKEWCDQQGGEFNECGSACRHQKDAAICTMQCVPFCKL